MILKTKNKGFTLIELAIILVIIGILVSLGVALIGPLTKRAKYIESKEIVDAATESVIGYGASNRRLPTTAEFPGAVRNPKDAWTKTLYYVVDANLTTIPTGTTDAICGRKTTAITVRYCTNVDCSTYNDIPNVAFVIISGADNYNIQTHNISNMVTVYEVDTPNIDDYHADMNRPEPYDDIVKWVTLDELRIKAGCVGPQLKILNNELPYGFQGSPYSAVVYADGGVPFPPDVGKYRWCTQGTAPPAGLTFTPDTFFTDCLNLPEASWGQADNLTISISGTPTASTFNLTFFVRDNNDPVANNDNVAQKTLVLTVNPVNP